MRRSRSKARKVNVSRIVKLMKIVSKKQGAKRFRAWKRRRAKQD